MSHNEASFFNKMYDRAREQGAKQERESIMSFPNEPDEIRGQPKPVTGRHKAYFDGRQDESSHSEALARELGEKVNGYKWILNESKDGWNLWFRINRFVRERMTSAPTQREAMQKALELLKEKADE